MGGSDTPDKTTTITELPAFAQPYAQSLLTRGAALSTQPMPVYSGQRSANLNSLQKTGMNLTANRAMNGSAEIQAGSQNLRNTLNGAYLNRDTGTNSFSGENPYLQATIDKAAGDITRNYNGAVNGTDATFARGGAFGGSAWQNAQQGNQRELAQGLADSSNALRSAAYNQSAQLDEARLNRNQSNYQAERANQMQGLGAGLDYGNQAYKDADALQAAGEIQYGSDQNLYTDQMDYFNEQAAAPYKSLDVLGNTIRGAVGGGGQTSQTAPGANRTAQAVGGAAAIASLLGKG